MGPIPILKTKTKKQSQLINKKAWKKKKKINESLKR